jgi:hypothetical protein
VLQVSGSSQRRKQPAGRAAGDGDSMTARRRVGPDLPGPTDSSTNGTLWIEPGSLRPTGGVIDPDRANAARPHTGHKRRVLADRDWRCDTNKPNRARSGGRLDRQGADYCRHEQRERKGPQGITPFLPTTRRGYASSGHPINGRPVSLETERPFGPPYGHTAAPEPRKAAPAQRMIDSREANNVVDA